MNKYDHFETFISEVISEANVLCIQKYGKDIDSLCHSDSQICNIIKKLLAKGWTSYISVVTLIDLNEPCSKDAIKDFFYLQQVGEVRRMQESEDDIDTRLLMLYKNLPISLKRIGDASKNDFECHINEVSYIDSMIANIAEQLLLNILTENQKSNSL